MFISSCLHPDILTSVVSFSKALRTPTLVRICCPKPLLWRNAGAARLHRNKLHSIGALQPPTYPSVPGASLLSFTDVTHLGAGQSGSQHPEEEGEQVTVLVFKELKMGWCLPHHTWKGCVMLICSGGERKARRLGRLLSDRVWDVMGREAGFQQLQGQREGDDRGRHSLR